VSGPQPSFLSVEAAAQLEAWIEQLVAQELDRRSAERAPQASTYLTVPEAAELLRCRRGRIDDLLSQRRLTRIKEGGRTLLLRAEIEERHLERHERRPT
jgi:excisionase family DNA binding protein